MPYPQAEEYVQLPVELVVVEEDDEEDTELEDELEEDTELEDELEEDTELDEDEDTDCTDEALDVVVELLLSLPPPQAPRQQARHRRNVPQTGCALFRGPLMFAGSAFFIVWRLV